MSQTNFGDAGLVSPFWLILRAVRGPLIAVAAICMFIDTYGVPQPGLYGSAGPWIGFRKLDRPAAIAAVGWATGTPGQWREQ